MPTTPNWYDSILNGRSFHGTYGQATMPVVNSPEQYGALEPWLRPQYTPINNGDNGDTRGYSGPGQTFTDENGRPLYLLNEGNMNGDPSQSGNIKDRNGVFYDPKYGMVTDPRNIVDRPTSSFTNGLNLTRLFIALAGGYGAASSGLGAGLGASAEAGGGGGAFGGASWTGAGSTAGAGASSGFMNANDAANWWGGTGAADNPSSGLFGSSGSSGLGWNDAYQAYRTGSNANSLANLAERLFGGNNPISRNGGGSNMPGSLLDLLTGGVAGYLGNRNNQNYSNDINHMLDFGSAGVSNTDRSGARNLVRGVYDGSISGDQIFDKVPGLRAMSDRGYNDIARKMSAQGDADPTSSARMREFANYNNELVSKAWNSEMDRATQVGGYNFNPGYIAAHGLEALSRLNQNRQGQSQGITSALDRLLNGRGGSGGLLDGIMNLFRGGTSAGGGMSNSDLENFLRNYGGTSGGTTSDNLFPGGNGDDGLDSIFNAFAGP